MEAQFKVIWANHGDDISLQYAGTGALKSGFTRTGVRTKAGLLDDGVKSGVRYYLNNFSDGHKQDALDLVTGTYVISKGKSPTRDMCLPPVSVSGVPSSTVLEPARPTCWSCGEPLRPLKGCKSSVNAAD